MDTESAFRFHCRCKIFRHGIFTSADPPCYFLYAGRRHCAVPHRHQKLRRGLVVCRGKFFSLRLTSRLRICGQTVRFHSDHRFFAFHNHPDSVRICGLWLRHISGNIHRLYIADHTLVSRVNGNHRRINRP